MELKLTEACAKQINILKEEDSDLCLRVEVVGGGCQGFQYEIKMDKSSEIDPEDDRCVYVCVCMYTRNVCSYYFNKLFYVYIYIYMCIFVCILQSYTLPTKLI